MACQQTDLASLLRQINLGKISGRKMGSRFGGKKGKGGKTRLGSSGLGRRDEIERIKRGLVWNVLCHNYYISCKGGLLAIGECARLSISPTLRCWRSLFVEERSCWRERERGPSKNLHIFNLALPAPAGGEGKLQGRRPTDRPTVSSMAGEAGLAVCRRLPHLWRQNFAESYTPTGLFSTRRLWSSTFPRKYQYKKKDEGYSIS